MNVCCSPASVQMEDKPGSQNICSTQHGGNMGTRKTDDKQSAEFYRPLMEWIDWEAQTQTGHKKMQNDHKETRMSHKETPSGQQAR